MPRPKLQKRVLFAPNVVYFKPRGVPMRNLKEVILSIEEIEAIRLKNIVNIKQEEAAKKMKTSQSTFQRIITSANKKIAEALINGYALKIEKE